jgi:hypothetical protein
MKFDIKYTKLGNQFFFISNLTEWHFSCRKDYNDIWLLKTGPLDKKEKVALREFKKIIKKYGFIYRKNKSIYLGKIFYMHQEKEIWQTLKKFVNKDEFDKIKNIFEIFTPRFEKIWKLYELYFKRLNVIKKSLNLKRNKELFNKLEFIINRKRKINKINVVMLFSPHGTNATGAGGANLGEKYVTLEVPDLKLNSWQTDYSVGILAHEIGHILFNKNKYRNIITKLIKKERLTEKKYNNLDPKRPLSEIIEEIVLESLVPFGALAQKYYKYKPIHNFFSDLYILNVGETFIKFKKNKKIPLRKWRKCLVWYIYPLMSYYIKNNKKIDENLIKNILFLIKK